MSLHSGALEVGPGDCDLGGPPESWDKDTAAKLDTLLASKGAHISRALGILATPITLDETERKVWKRYVKLGLGKQISIYRGDETMAFDYKKEYKEFYAPKSKPCVVTVPSMNYVAVRGSGDPNLEDGEYKQSIGLLYGIAYTIKMSKKGTRKIEGYFDFVVPPLEGFWWQDGVSGADYAHKENFKWISVIRLPDFVKQADFDWAVSEATKKKKTDFSKVEFMTYDEGLCVQCMHIGPYDSEPATVSMMHEYINSKGYELDITDERMHHEIYLSDARKVEENKLKTVIRHPIKRVQ